MRPDDLAARSLERAAETDQAVLAELAGAGDIGVRPGRELAEHVGLPERTVRGAITRLSARGLAGRDGKRRVWATDAGRSEAGTAAPGLSLAPTLDGAVACLPAEALRAFARLQLAAVPARWHLAREYDTGWSGFIALGPTKTGKTSVAALLCRVYGIDELAAIKVAQHQTPGSLFARRARDRQSPTGYRLERSPLLQLSYACVDEWDKASREVQAAAGGLLLGNSAGELEGERLTIRPTVYVTLNTGRAGLGVLHEAHIRRSVVLDTTPLRQLLADIDEDMARLLGGQVPIPRLALERIRPAASALPAELRALLRAELRAGLTDDGWRTTDVEPLARIALGRAALTSGPLQQAVLATALDYLTCAATLGHTRPGFAARLAGQLGARGALVPNPAAAEEELERRRKLDTDTQRKAGAARLAFQADRERKAAIALAARDAMGRTRDVERQAIARALTTVVGDLRTSRSAPALEAAWQAATPYLEQARNWTQARQAAAAERDRRDADASRQRKLERDMERLKRQAVKRGDQERKTRTRQAAQGAAAELRRFGSEIWQLEQLAARATTRAGESPLEVLRTVRILDGEPVLRFAADAPPESRGERALYLLAGTLCGLAGASAHGTPGTWVCACDPSLTFRGSENACDHLAHWKASGTQQVLAAALERLRARQAALIGPTATPATQTLPAVLRPPAPLITRRANPPSRCGLARCPSCGTTYNVRALYGTRIE
ncbi:MAG TPA: hypothetical protein VK613_04925, partial [Gaiellaceae bacterium]|nr:hypothetical protein [Gaiellaceae bacterium]